MCEKCVAAVRKHFPDCPESSIAAVLFNATPFPLGDHLDVEKALIQAKKDGVLNWFEIMGYADEILRQEELKHVAERRETTYGELLICLGKLDQETPISFMNQSNGREPDLVIIGRQFGKSKYSVAELISIARATDPTYPVVIESTSMEPVSKANDSSKIQPLTKDEAWQIRNAIDSAPPETQHAVDAHIARAIDEDGAEYDIFRGEPEQY